MSFIIREMAEEVSCITEAVGDEGKKQTFIEGVFLMGNAINRNKRVYPVELLERETMRYQTDFIKRNRAFGELDHPKGSSINLDRVSHLITDLRREGNNFIGKAKVLESLPMGAIAKGLIESGATLAVSSRGTGSMKRNRNGVMEVQEDFYLATAADIVADPSAQVSFVQGLVEGYQWVFDMEGNHVEIAETIEDTKKTIHREWKSLDEERSIQIFEQFVRKALSK